MKIHIPFVSEIWVKQGLKNLIFLRLLEVLELSYTKAVRLNTSENFCNLEYDLNINVHFEPFQWLWFFSQSFLQILRISPHSKMKQKTERISSSIQKFLLSEMNEVENGLYWFSWLLKLKDNLAYWDYSNKSWQIAALSHQICVKVQENLFICIKYKLLLYIK